MDFKRLRIIASIAITSLLLVSTMAPIANAQVENLPVDAQQTAYFPLGIEVRDLEGVRTNQINIEITDTDGYLYDGMFNEDFQWVSTTTLPEGLYYIQLTPPAGMTTRINNTAPQYASITEQPNLYTIYLNEANLGSLSTVFGAFELVEIPEIETTYQVSAEIRGLDGTRTTDVGITISDDSGMVYEGSYNDYAQWLTTNELFEGTYYITLSPPEGLTSVINQSANQYAVATETPDVYTLTLNQDTLGNLSAVYGAFNLVETAPVEQVFYLSADVIGLDGPLTDSVEIEVTDAEGTVYEGTFNDSLQWSTLKELPEGEYFITLTTPDESTSQLNLNTDQYAMDTNTPNVYSIFLNEDNLGSQSSVHGAFELVELPEETYPLGIEVRGLDNSPSDEVGITIEDTDGTVFEGAYNEYLQWLTTDELPGGQYLITLDTPEGTVSQVNEATNQFAIPSDQPNVYNIIVNEANLGSSPAVYGAFRLIEAPEENSTQLGIEVQGVNDSPTDEVGITIEDSNGVVYSGEYNANAQWLTTNDLPSGHYTITLNTPAGTVSQIDDTAEQFAAATDTDNVYTLDLNDENVTSDSTVFGAFSLASTGGNSDESSVQSSDESSNNSESDESASEESDEDKASVVVVQNNNTLPSTGENSSISSYIVIAIALIASSGILLYKRQKLA